MAHLGEPICDDIDALCRKYDGIVTEQRDVGLQCQNVARLLHQRNNEGTDLTISQLVKEWRSKADDIPQW